MAATDGALSRRLALAACSLLAAGNVLPSAAAESGAEPNGDGAASARADWRVDGSWLAYTESDDRVAVRKTLVDLTRDSGTGSVGVQLIHDTMSGASPTGALRDESGQVTYTGASGGEGFTTASTDANGALAVFEDTRTQAGLSVDSELDRLRTLSYGAVISQESDYDSFGGNVGLARANADKSTTIDAGIAATFDSIYRSERGDTPAPLSDASEASSFDKGSRSTFDALLGVTQVLNRRTLAQVNLGIGASSGYHSDPYKVISAVDDEGRPVANLHDSRPDRRLRTTLFGKLVHQPGRSKNAIHLRYRLYADDWGVLSNTLDARYRIALNDTMYLEPHARFYRQGAADFYAPSLSSDASGDPLLPSDGYASADYRLDAMRSVTLGIKYGVRIGQRTQLRLRAEYLDQRFDTAQFDSLSAIILQSSVSYRF